MKKTFLIIGAIAAAAYFIISAIKGTFNPMNWFASTTPPAEGSTCTASGKQGTIKNGVCVVVDIVAPADQIIRTGRRVKCYLKPAGTSCNPRIYDSMLGWGALYSQTSTTCCYTF